MQRLPRPVRFYAAIGGVMLRCGASQERAERFVAVACFYHGLAWWAVQQPPQIVLGLWHGLALAESEQLSANPTAGERAIFYFSFLIVAVTTILAMPVSITRDMMREHRGWRSARISFAIPDKEGMSHV